MILNDDESIRQTPMTSNLINVIIVFAVEFVFPP